METQDKFKMTFKNSWWQCLVALILSWIVVRTAVMAVLIFSHVGLGDEDILRAGAIAALVFAIWFSHFLSRKTWEQRRKLQRGN